MDEKLKETLSELDEAARGKMLIEMERELGKLYFYESNGDAEKRSQGIKYLVNAAQKKDPEAMYHVAKMHFDGVVRTVGVDSVEHGLTYLLRSADAGCIQAQAMLNSYCEDRYEENFGDSEREEGELTDFSGKPVRINRKGLFTPVDAVLEYKDNKNILTLSVNVMFNLLYDLDDPELFSKAVLNGISAWAGEYEVFGGQKVIVRMNISLDDKLFDSVYVIPMTNTVSAMTRAVSDKIGIGKNKKRIEDILDSKRSFATLGLKWSATSRKLIYIQSPDGKFDDYNEIMHTAKHEFGHALGLGDLYRCKSDGLEGVEFGTYKELDSYSVTDKIYNLVMCDHHGPVSNNDIEMVILAFRENRIQLYQKNKIKDKISSALGKGN